MFVKRIVHGFKVVGFRIFDYCEDTTAKMDVGIKTYKELCKIYGDALVREQEVIPTRIEGDFYVTTVDETNVMPESWVDAVSLISTRYLLGESGKVTMDLYGGSRYDVCDKLRELAMCIKGLQLDIIEDGSKYSTSLKVQAHSDNIVSVLLFTSRETGKDFAELLHTYASKNSSSSFETAEKAGRVRIYDISDWKGNFDDDWMFIKYYKVADYGYKDY